MSPLRLHDTLTGQVQPVVPLTPGRLGIYVCGVTPYSESHIGHAMSAIVYDVLVRYLRWPGNTFGGLEVTYVTNYTDVDDKLIDRGHELEMDPLELAEVNIVQWEDEQARLGLVSPDVRPRVSTHIEAILALTERLVANGHAYATASGDVYFRVRSDDDYGKLSHRNIDELRTGTRFEPGEEKEFALDFALWKAAKAGEPAWPSPWGAGRPGWHIECSAMAQQHLGDSIDIHGGGLDLQFPHHENEIAQSESATGEPFARIWMHNGLVQRDGEKMSKSIGNVVSVREALERWSPDALRLFVLSSHYRSPNNLTDEAIEAAARGVERLAAVLQLNGGMDSDAAVDASEARARFIAAMDDDLGTAQALAAMFELARAINRGHDGYLDITSAQATLRELADVLGLSLEPPAVDAPLDEEQRKALIALARPFSELLQIEKLEDETDRVKVLMGVLGLRQSLREKKRFAEADSLRTDIEKLGYELEDRPDGRTSWKSVTQR